MKKLTEESLLGQQKDLTEEAATAFTAAFERMVPEVNLPDVAALPSSSTAGEPSAGHGQCVVGLHSAGMHDFWLRKMRVSYALPERFMKLLDGLKLQGPFFWKEGIPWSSLRLAGKCGCYGIDDAESKRQSEGVPSRCFKAERLREVGWNVQQTTRILGWWNLWNVAV